jgi:transposase
MSELQLTASQRRRLEQQLRSTQDASLFRRILAVLEAADGRSVAEIAHLVRTSRVSVYHWIDRYDQDRDPACLADHRGGNRPSLWTEELQAVLRSSLGQRPDHFGYQAVEWTVALIQEHLARWTGTRPAATTIRRRLHAFGYVWKRPRYVLDPDPEREKKTADSPGNPPLAGRVGQALRG